MKRVTSAYFYNQCITPTHIIRSINLLIFINIKWLRLLKSGCPCEINDKWWSIACSVVHYFRANFFFYFTNTVIWLLVVWFECNQYYSWCINLELSEWVFKFKKSFLLFKGGSPLPDHKLQECFKKAITRGKEIRDLIHTACLDIDRWSVNNSVILMYK